MAKQDSMISLRGTMAGITFVKSPTYGDHIRAARGTYKEAKINDTLKKESARLQKANVPAKILKDAIDPLRQDLPGGLLWQRLVSMFRKQLRDHNKIDFATISPFEVNEDYPFERIIKVGPEMKLNRTKTTLQIDLRYNHHPLFKKASNIDGYRITAIGIFPDLKSKSAKTISVDSPVMPLAGPVSFPAIRMNVPSGAKAVILCLKIEGCSNGETHGTRATKGLRVVSAITI